MRVTVVIDLDKGDLRKMGYKRAIDLDVNGRWSSNRDIINGLKEVLKSFESPETPDDEFVRATEAVSSAREKIDHEILTKGLY